MHAADGLPARIDGVVHPFQHAVLLGQTGAGQERNQRVAHADRAGTGAAAAVRRGERLVQVHMENVDPDAAHVGVAHDGVQVRAVAVDEAAALVHQIADRLDVGLEQAERVRVRDHDARAVVVHDGFDGFDGQDAVGTDGHLHRGEAAQGRAGGVGAVRGVGDEHLGALVALRPVPRLNEHDAGQFAVRARGRLEAARLKAGHGAEHPFGFVQHAQRALRIFGGEQRMRAGKTGQRRDLFVDFGVVLHGARTERVHARVHAEVPRGQAGVVAHHVQFGALGQARRALAQQGFGQHLRGAGRVVVHRQGQTGSAAAFYGFGKDGFHSRPPSFSTMASTCARVLHSVQASKSTSSMPA